jgi:O-antigen biosynthesis protein
VERPLFKPDWSPDFFLSGNYVAHFMTVRRELLQSVGGFHSEFDGAQDYDLVLRIVERTQRIHHVPRVLYHWRRSASSSAIDIRQKPGQLDAARRAVEEHLQGKGIEARVAIDWPTHTFWVQRDLIEPEKISIVVSLREGAESIARCLESVSRTSYSNYEIVLIGGDSASEAHKSLKPFAHRLLEYDAGLSYAAACNFAVAQTQSPWVLFLRSGLEAIDPQWLDIMAEHIQRREVGAVGALLLGRDNMIEHAGIVVVGPEIAQHAFRGCSADDPATLRRAGVTRNCSAVSGACLLTRRDVFAQVGGFDERLVHGFYDVDLCLKLRRAGYLIVYTPFARLRWRDQVERATQIDSGEVGIMRERWAEMLRRDPYYNPNLSREHADFSLGN